MKKVRFVILLTVFLTSLIFVVPTTAQGPAGDWVSSIHCINQDDVNPANITLAFYQENSSTAALTYADTIAAGKSKNYYTPTSPPGVPDPFLGSLVVSSSTPLSCTATNSTTAAGTEVDPYRFGSTGGFNSSEASPIMYATQVERNFWDWDSYIAIQNTSMDPVDVTVAYTNRYGVAFPSATEHITIQGQASRILYQESNTALGDGFIGSAKITADDGTTPLAVVQAFYNDAADYNTAQFHAFAGASSGGSKLLVPYLMRNYYGYNAGLMIVNVGSAATSFKVTYTINGSNYVYQHSVDLAPGENKDFYLPNVTELDPVDGLTDSLRFGYAVIEATDTVGTPNPAGELVANVNQSHLGVFYPQYGGRGASYNAFPVDAQRDTLFMPNFARHVNGIFSSGFHVSNFSAVPGTCDITFVDDADANITGLPILANSYFSMYAPNIPNLDDGYNSGVVITCTVGVIGIGNMSGDAASGTFGDSFIQTNLQIPEVP